MIRRSVIFLLSLLCFTSCNLVDKLFHTNREIVARVGTEILYSYEIEKLIPEGTQPEDSLRMVEQYVHSWALNRLLLNKAEKVLPKSEKDIDDEVSEFRKNLLTFRYEKYYLEERLDTTVTEAEMISWYDAHADEYLYPFSVIRARVVRISPKSPYYMEIKEKFNASYGSEITELEDLCYASSEKYTDFMKNWVPSSNLASTLGITQDECEKQLASDSFFELDVESSHFIVFIIDRVAPGKVTPLAFNSNAIHDLIISRRKQELLVTLEQDLFNEAVGSKTYKRYN